jgi:hypothetical protein
MSTGIAIPQEAFLLFDRADDAALIARIQGAALKEYVYHFRSSGQDVYGLSVDGYEECKRELAKTGEVIEEETIEMERENPDEAMFRARATRWYVNAASNQRLKLDSSIGLKRQPKFIITRKGEVVPNEFWYEMGGRKAMRNAGLSLIPETIQQRVIAAYKDRAKIVDQTPAQVDADVAKYHATMDAKDERDALVAEVKELWRYLAWTKAQVKACLRARDLSESLVDAHVSWATVDLAVITDLRDAMKKEAGR